MGEGVQYDIDPLMKSFCLLEVLTSIPILQMRCSRCSASAAPANLGYISVLIIIIIIIILVKIDQEMRP